ncbi:MAG: hypothetical protein JRE43_10090 [Deltaproteobacteria bacterium]|nr:hypothetical protein [Deltaproteobacteria bacterium]
MTVRERPAPGKHRTAGDALPGSWRAHGPGAKASLLGLAAVQGCAPTVDVLGVYFPGWLVSGAAGVTSTYALVYWLGRRAGARPLAESGLFFLSLALGIALCVWWVCFSGF